MTAEEFLKDKQFTVEVNGVYADIELEDGKLADLLEQYHKQEVEANVIPHIIPDDLYLLIAEAKAKRYGLGFEHIELQGAYSDGQCDTIDIIEKWFKNKLLKQ